MSSRSAVPDVRPLATHEPLEAVGDPVAQWLLWEQQANLVGFRVSTQPVEVEVACVASDELEIHLALDAPASLTQRFLRGGRVLFARHPLNRDASVAYFDAPAVDRWSCRFTSSRTLVVEDGAAPLFSLKLATDHPHPDFHQPEKTKLREEALGAIDVVRLIERVDRQIGPPPEVALVREAIVVLVRDQEAGFLVRDLRVFQDGHHYLPALSLPWVGRQIARRHGQPFERFWGRHYAAAVGRAKARLLAHYGLWYETPNPQNVLIQLDRELRPTGTLVFRDLGDCDCATDALRCREIPWTRLHQDIRPETQNSFWAFDEAGSHALEATTLADWYARHDRAYFAELSRRFPPLAPRSELSAPALLAYWNAILRSDEGQRAVARLFAALRKSSS